MSTRQDRERDHVDIFLNRSIHHHLWGLVQPRINDLESGVSKRTRDYHGAAVVPIETHLADQDSDWCSFSLHEFMAQCICNFRGQPEPAWMKALRPPASGPRFPPVHSQLPKHPLHDGVWTGRAARDLLHPVLGIRGQSLPCPTREFAVQEGPYAPNDSPMTPPTEISGELEVGAVPVDLLA